MMGKGNWRQKRGRREIEKKKMEKKWVKEDVKGSSVFSQKPKEARLSLFL